MRRLKQQDLEIVLEESPSRRYPELRYPKRYDTMPCSMLVDSYCVGISKTSNITADSKGTKYPAIATTGELYVNINAEMRDWVVDAWKSREPEYADGYISFPPRFAIACQSNVDADRFLKIVKWTAFSNEIAKMRYIGDIGRNLAYYWVSTMYDSMKYDKKHVYGYVMDHKGSKCSKGMTWLDQWKIDECYSLYLFTMEFMREWKEHFFDTGDWCISASTINYGSRARSPTVSFSAFSTFVLERTRQIGFREGPSTVNAFVSHDVKVNLMRYIFDTFESILGCKIYSPKTEGGWVYWVLREAYLKGKVLTNYDVSGMELITPSIINGKIGGFIYGVGAVIGYMGPIPELLSGVGPTSDWDMIAHLILLSQLIIKPPEFIVILGDDCTLVGGELKDSNLYERQPRDESIHRTLGLTTTESMHPVGLNITVDTADKRETLVTRKVKYINGSRQVIEEYTLSGMKSKWYDNKMEDADRWKICDYFTGTMQGKQNHEVIKFIKPEENVYSPREMIERAIGIHATT